MEDLTLICCNYNTDKLVLNLLKSLYKTSKTLPKVLIGNTYPKIGNNVLTENGIPYVDLAKDAPISHGKGVDELLKKVKTRYVLLVDSDIIFLKDINIIYDKFIEHQCVLMGRYIPTLNLEKYKVKERISPWFCLMDLEIIKNNNIKFFDEIRSIKKEKSENV